MAGIIDGLVIVLGLVTFSLALVWYFFLKPKNTNKNVTAHGVGRIKSVFSRFFSSLRFLLFSAVVIAVLVAIVLAVINWNANGPSLNGVDPVMLEKVSAATPLKSFEVNGKGWQTLRPGLVSVDGKNRTSETGVLLEDDFNTMRIYGHSDVKYNSQYGSWVNLSLGYRKAPFNIILDLFGPCQVKYIFIDMESNGNAFHPSFHWDYANPDNLNGARIDFRLEDKDYKVYDGFQGNEKIANQSLDKGLSFAGRFIKRDICIFVESGKNVTIRNVGIK